MSDSSSLCPAAALGRTAHFLDTKLPAIAHQPASLARSRRLDSLDGEIENREAVCCLLETFHHLN